MSTTTYRVEGMTCNHCVQAVTREVSALPGVDEAVVDLQARTLAVSGDAAEAAVAAAVEEAGYALAAQAS
ncbi:heavy-metal-associated domain-containing protein [Microbacterium horticulturae]|uniref:Heavy-metal-associated domain-containing protein n=1 Tax=Microbacterium horticulturae TaxID=3028316 RepID=A0ABY8BUB0_9MICO|nr:heavy-metal-associated domain-containing protein [Microbacterium sp. KACC 23027]WEG07761.1 heavy-metal-associated domain-containing protein [Microbacterium sp. KACC 23027]